jgi:hypothetical protein
VSPATFFFFLLSLSLAPPGLLLPLALRLWRLLHTRSRPRLLYCRASLLWLRSLSLALRLWRLLHTRCRPRLLHCRAPLRWLRSLDLALRFWRLLHTRCRPRLPYCRASLRWLRSLYLALWPWRLLHTWRRPRLLPLALDCRASLLRRGLDRSLPLNVFATQMLWLRACAGRGSLLERS